MSCNCYGSVAPILSLSQSLESSCQKGVFPSPKMGEKSLRSSQSSTITSTLPPYTECNDTPSCSPSCFPPSNNASTGLLREKGTKKRSGSPPAPPDAANKPSRFCRERHHHHSSLLHLTRKIRQEIKSGSTKYHHWKRSIGKALRPCKEVLTRVLAITLFLVLTPFCCWISPVEWFHVVGPAVGGCDCIDCQ